MSAMMHDASNLAACFGCFAQPGTEHDPGCKYGLQAEVVALRTSLEEARRGYDLAKALCGERDFDAAFAALEALTAQAEEARQERDALSEQNKRLVSDLGDMRRAHRARIGELEKEAEAYMTGEAAQRWRQRRRALQPPTEEP